MLQILEHFHETLQYVNFCGSCIPAHINFPKLKVLEIENDFCVAKFKTNFPLLLKNMETLETVIIHLLYRGDDVCEYIAENYIKHCISAQASAAFNYQIPAQILTRVNDLKHLQNYKYVSRLQYLHVLIYSIETSISKGWDKYREIFDLCSNLKAVELTWHRQFRRKTTLAQVPEGNQNFWLERISYFETRGIRIVDGGEIFAYQWTSPLSHTGPWPLQTKLAKEAGITWKFQLRHN